jgi:hypothetical protein
MTNDPPNTDQSPQDVSPEHRVRRGCNFIVGLFAVLTAVNSFSAGGFDNLAVQIFAALFVVSVIVRILLSREGK